MAPPQLGNGLLVADKEIPWWTFGTAVEIRPDAFFEAPRPGKDTYIGTGNFKGITQKLPFLKKRRIKAIWLTPFLKSGGTDGGYDVTDFREIDPQYGTLEDLKELVREAHQLGMKVIMDWVPCHTSDQHPWFQASRRNPLGKYGNYYIWSRRGDEDVLYIDADGQYRDVRNILADDPNPRTVLARVGQSRKWKRTAARCWAFDPVRRQWYWHRFKPSQPALNYANPEVETENLSNMLFWLEEVGIDGFRVDAVPFLYKKRGTSHEDVEEVHDWIRRTRAALKARFPHVMLLCESDLPQSQMETYEAGDQFDSTFDFRLRVAMDLQFALRNAAPLLHLLLTRPQLLLYVSRWLMASNHDDHRGQWKQWRLTPPEILAILLAFYGDGVRGEPFLGDAVVGNMAQMLRWNMALMKLFYLIRMAMPGLLVDYYADLIAMGHHPLLARGLGPNRDGRDGVRTPMHWTSGLNAGFSQAAPGDLFLPVINTIDMEDYPEKRGDYRLNNAEAALADEGSWLHWRDKATELGNRKPLLGFGHAKPLLGRGLPDPEGDEPIQQFGIVRYLEGLNRAIICLFNLSEEDQPFSTELPPNLTPFSNSKCRTLSGSKHVTTLSGLNLDIPLPAQGGFMLEIGYGD